MRIGYRNYRWTTDDGKITIEIVHEWDQTRMVQVRISKGKCVLHLNTHIGDMNSLSRYCVEMIEREWRESDGDDAYRINYEPMYEDYYNLWRFK